MTFKKKARRGTAFLCLRFFEWIESPIGRRNGNGSAPPQAAFPGPKGGSVKSLLGTTFRKMPTQRRTEKVGNLQDFFMIC